MIARRNAWPSENLSRTDERPHHHLETQPGPVLNLCRRRPCSSCGMIPEIDIWRAAQLMLKRNGEKALEQSTTRADELAADGDHDSAVTWRRITHAVLQLANTTPPGPVH